MAVKKSELYSSLWASCDELRGGMDASQYKDYVLTLLFVKYVSDRYKGKPGHVLVPDGGSFDDMIALKGKPEIGDGINKIIGRLAEANELKGVIDITDWTDDAKLGSGKEMVDRLTKLIGIFQNPSLNFSRNRADDDDILGDAYEYLMRHFATESGKSKGQFYTPAEVSRVMASLLEVDSVDDQKTTVYDPTCGSGSLLLKVVDRTQNGLSVYGQEMDNATQALAVMNMWLHGDSLAVIRKGNSIASPQFLDENQQLTRFDYVVANPPFSSKNWSSGLIDDNTRAVQDPYHRFDGFGIPPAKNGDYAFLLHIVKSIKSTGKGAVILPHGVLFRGNAEASIREQLISRGLIKAIIGLPANLFYGTGIPACIILIDKSEATERDGIFMVDASKGFIKDGNKNRLRERDMHKIVDVFKTSAEVKGYSRFVPNSEIESNAFNLNIPRYIDTREKEDIQDLHAHINGGIPKRDVNDLEAYWKVFPELESALFEGSENSDYFNLKVESEKIKETINQDSNFKQFVQSGLDQFNTWFTDHQDQLDTITEETRPKRLITSLGESLLVSFRDVLLVDEYAIYQILLDYWNEVMKDDVYMIVENGWKADIQPIMGKNGKARKDQFQSDLIPIDLLKKVEFPEEMEKLETLENQLDGILASLEELAEEHGSEDGLLNEVMGDNNKINKAAFKKRLKDKDLEEDEAQLLHEIDDLYKKDTNLKHDIKNASSSLFNQVLSRFATLANASDSSISEVKTIVIQHKWKHSLEEKIRELMNSIGQQLTNRVKELAERYAEPLPSLEDDLVDLRDKMRRHLQKMGITMS